MVLRVWYFFPLQTIKNMNYPLISTRSLNDANACTNRDVQHDTLTPSRPPTTLCFCVQEKKTPPDHFCVNTLHCRVAALSHSQRSKQVDHLFLSQSVNITIYPSHMHMTSPLLSRPTTQSRQPISRE